MKLSPCKIQALPLLCSPFTTKRAFLVIPLVTVSTYACKELFSVANPQLWKQLSLVDLCSLSFSSRKKGNISTFGMISLAEAQLRLLVAEEPKAPGQKDVHFFRRGNVGFIGGTRWSGFAKISTTLSGTPNSAMSLGETVCPNS